MTHFQPLNKWTLFFMVIYLTISQVALDLYLPSIPNMVDNLHTTAALVQSTIAIYLIAIAISQFFYGPLSDSFGRRPMALIGCGIAIVGSFICCIANSIELLLIGRLIQGIGLGFGSVLARAILRDVISEKKQFAKYVSYQSMAWSCVPLVAPVIGGYIGHWLSWRGNFIALLILSIILFILSFCKLEETKEKQQRQNFNPLLLLKNYSYLLKKFNLVGYMIIIALQYSAMLTILQLAPFIFQNNLGYSQYAYGWFILLVGAGSLLGALSNRFLSQRFELKNIIFCALIFAILMIVLMVGLALSWFNAWVIIIPLFFLRIGGGLTYSNCITEGMAQLPEHAGSISSLFGVVITAGAALITSMVAHIPQYKQWTLVACLFVELALMLLIFLFIQRFKLPVKLTQF